MTAKFKNLDKKGVDSLTVLVIALIIMSGIFITVEAKSGNSSSHITSWADYTDPYGRYSIKYPLKWRIQPEPVHSNGNYLLEVPLK